MKNNYKEVRSMSAGRVLLQIIGKTAALTLLLVAFTATTAQAQDVCYVDTGGSDAQDGTTAGTANETIAGCLAEAYVEDGVIISIEAGTYNEAVTVTDDLIFEAREFGQFNRVLIDGGVEIQADVIFRQDSQTATDGIFRIGDGALGASLVVSDGSLTIEDAHEDGRVQIPADGTVARDDDTDVTGAVTYLGAANLEYTDDDASDTDFAAGGEFPDDFGGGSLNVDIEDDNVLSFASGTGIADLDVAAGSELDGTIVIDEPIDVAGPGNVGNLEVNDDVVVSSDAAVTDVNIANDNDITFNLGANTLSVHGDFVRLGGTFTAAAASELAFLGDETDATFSPGPNFEIGFVTVDKDGQQLAITDDISVIGAGGPAFVVADGSTVDLGGQQVNVNGAGAEINGILTNASTVAFLVDGAGIRGSGVYGNILINTPGADATVGGAGEHDIRFAGTLTLFANGITVDPLNGSDISPFGDNAAVSVNLESAGQDIDGPFNTLENDYDLEYTGDMGAATRTVGTELATDNVINLTFNVEDGTVDATGAPDGTVAGDVSLNAADDAYTVQLDGEVTIEGSLTVADGATLDAIDVALEGANNSVEGTVTAATTLALADGVTVTGIADTDDDDYASSVGSVEATGDVTIDAIQVIDGDLTTNEDATLQIGLADDMSITGNVVLDGASATLASDLNVGGDVNANAGTLAFDGSDVILDGSFDGLADVEYTSSGGAVVFTTSGASLGLGGETLPHVVLEEDVAIALSSDAVVSESLMESGTASLDLDGNALTVGGSITSDGGNIIGTAGDELTFVTATLTLDGDASVDPATTIADGETLTVEAADPEDEWTLTLAGDDLNLEGTLILDQNHLYLDGGDLLNAEGEITASSGIVTMDGGDIEVDGELAIANLTAEAATDLGVATDGSLTVTDLLTLNDALTEDGEDDELVIGDGATIVINAAAPLAEAPDFEGSVSLVYSVITDSGNEIPAEGEGTVNDVDVDADVELQSDLTVDGTLALAAAIDNTTEDVALVLGDGATLSLEIDNTTALAAADIDATNYTLEYAGGDDEISDVEFVDGATVTALIIDVGAGNTITNTVDGDGAERTVNDFTIESGEFELDEIDFNVAGNLTMAGDDIVNAGPEVAMLSFVGDTDQNWTLEDDFAAAPLIGIELDKENATLVTLSGGDVDLRDDNDPRTLFLSGGILETMGDAQIFLYQDNATQGFERDIDEDAGEVSHVAGNVTKFLEQGDPFEAGRSARFEFPTGSPDGDYRPYVLTFREDVVTNTFITVNHEDVNPGGTLGLPVADDEGTVIGDYPDYYWLVDASTSLGQAQSFDVELTATEIGIPFTDDDDLRIIRRIDGDATTNQWSIQGSAANYDNFMQVESGDTTAVVRVTSSTGGIVTQGARFTLGLSSRAPVFAENTPDTLEVEEGEILTETIEADAQAVGRTIAYSLDGAPDFVSIDAETGVLTAEPLSADVGDHTFDIIADDGTDSSTFQMTIIVNPASSSEIASELPEEFALRGNYPNPFNPSTTIRFDLPAAANVSVEVYDMLGRQVMTVPSTSIQAGAERSVDIDAAALTSGVYVYRVIAESNADSMIKTGTMTLVK